MKQGVLLSLLGLMLSCASAGPMPASRSSSASEAAALTVTPPTSLQLHAEITAAADDLDAAATSLGLPANPGAASAATFSADATTAPAETMCAMPPPVNETCHSTCQLATRICSDAGNICKLAAQLPGDEWANGKCDAGKRSCEAARARCCACH